MRVRQLDQNGDMTFGAGAGNFLVNSPAAVAQNIDTRLGLWTGEWFLDTTEGTPWATAVLGKGTAGIGQAALYDRILETAGVTAINSFSSSVDPNRKMTVAGVVETQFSGTATFGG